MHEVDTEDPCALDAVYFDDLLKLSPADAKARFLADSTTANDAVVSPD